VTRTGGENGLPESYWVFEKGDSPGWVDQVGEKKETKEIYWAGRPMHRHYQLERPYHPDSKGGRSCFLPKRNPLKNL